MFTENFDIFTMKYFQRLRNKAQLFSSQADDHYHTRLLHSLEVEAISMEIAKMIKAKFPDLNIDLKKLSQIALLHDIGHTPYGHAGERMLHEICSGSCERFNKNKKHDFSVLDKIIGFKHNINSALLYKEYMIKHNIKIKEFDEDVIEGIAKHSNLSYDENDGIDYGFELVNSGLKKEIDFKNPYSRTLEGRIVSYADEIAQVYSDYIDVSINLDNNIAFQESLLIKSVIQKHEKEVSKEIDGIIFYNNKLIANYAKNRMIKLFVGKVIINNKNYQFKEKTLFDKLLKDFEDVRKKTIDTCENIRVHDSIKKEYIYNLFTHYFYYPDIEDNEFIKEFLGRIKRIHWDGGIKSEIDSFNGPEIFEYARDKAYAEINNSKTPNKIKKQYKIVFSIYVRTIAIFISKMTDNYADHKTAKIIYK